MQRVQKVLDDTDLKLASVVSDITGVSARAMLEALLVGQANPASPAQLAKGRLRQKRQELERALLVVRPHHCFLLAEHLDHLDFLDEAIEQVNREVEERLRPLEEEVQHLDTIPGVNRTIAEVLLAEVGMDLKRFPTAGHPASWASMCPGNGESVGKRLSGKTRKGSP